MTLAFALLLGIIQGITEFLPISSSGHLALLQRLFGQASVSDYLLFDLVCHLGTLVAIIALFSKEIRNITAQQLTLILLGTLPLFPLALVVKQIKALFDAPALLGIDFMITALILYVGSRFSLKERKLSKRSALLVGMSQTLALLPGISRSGTTISCANMLGIDDKEAVRFSFLLAIPTILGATVLETIELYRKGNPLEIGAGPYLIGFFSSLIFGLLALKFLQTLGMKRLFRYFAWYCISIGTFSIWLS